MVNKNDWIEKRDQLMATIPPDLDPMPTQSDIICQINLYIGKRIASRRKALRITTTNLAIALGISRATLRRWENGEGSPTIPMLYLIATLLDQSIEDFLPVSLDNVAPF